MIDRPTCTKDKAYLRAVHDYLRLRISVYLESMIPEQKLRDNEEIRLYDNIMEIVSMIDYTGMRINPYTEGLLRTMKEKHKEHMERLIKEGKYKIL